MDGRDLSARHQFVPTTVLRTETVPSQEFAIVHWVSLEMIARKLSAITALMVIVHHMEHATASLDGKAINVIFQFVLTIAQDAVNAFDPDSVIVSKDGLEKVALNPQSLILLSVFICAASMVNAYKEFASVKKGGPEATAVNVFVLQTAAVMDTAK